MEKIIIKLKINEDNNIIVNSETNKKKLEIDYKTKNINALDVYTLFDYKENNEYEIKSDIENVKDDKIKEYYDDIIQIFTKIADEINTLRNI